MFFAALLRIQMIFGFPRSEIRSVQVLSLMYSPLSLPDFDSKPAFSTLQSIAFAFEF